MSELLDNISISVSPERVDGENIPFTRHKDFCVRGHPLFGENLSVVKYKTRTVRHCKTCRREAEARSRARRQNGIKEFERARITHCKRGHPFTEGSFYLTKKGSRACLKCKSLWKKNRRLNQKEKCSSEYRESLMRRYGLTSKKYDEILLSQNGSCAICLKTPEKERTKRLSVDHDHKTGMVRGLLCSRCNFAIGLMDDSPYKVKRAMNYLAEFHSLINNTSK